MSDPNSHDPRSMSPLMRAKGVFLAVRTLPIGERLTELERLCAGDAEVRGLVEGLLAAEEAPLPFETLAADIAAAREDMGSPATPWEPGEPAADPHLGTRIGNYRLLEKIGEGGFGMVYLAEQERPVRRRVALKILKLGMDTRQVVARFEAERQALAIMDHPGIARVFDAGATPTGRPYFVMELCPGSPITTYCDRERLGVRPRLDLFVQICQAVQHAHQKGLIHRDIKPGNILVSEVDGRPLAKVIDFGIAKATESRLTEKTLFTESRQLIGTPEYMSPEQAQGSLDIDTRTDLYSLGVLLYELLTGSTPFSGHDLRSAAFAEIQRIIREVEPPRPSTRLEQSSETIASVAASRNIEPRRLGTIIRGELDWIVMKSLEKDRQRRYATAADFAADISRYLDNQPVLARPASTLYRARKFAARNRLAVISATAVVVSLAAGLIATGTMYIKADRARAAEAVQHARGEAKAETTKAINDFLTQDMLAAANPWEGAGRKVTVAETLDKAAGRVGSRFADKPTVEASIRTTLGESYRSLGLYAEAQPHYDRAVELRRATEQSDEADLADALRMRAANMQVSGKDADAEPVVRDALARHTRLAGPDSAEVADDLECLADVQIGRSQYAEAENTLNQALRIRTGLAKRNAPGAGEDLAIARLTNTIGSSLTYQGKYEEAEKKKLEAVEMFKAARGPGGGEHSPYVAQTLNDLASVYFNMHRYDESEKCYDKAIPMMVEALGAEHPTVIVARRSLANTIGFEGRTAEAEPMLKDAIAAGERTVGPAHPETMASINSLADLYLRTKRHAEAEPLLQSLLERAEKSFGPKHADTLKYASNLAWCERHLGKAANAEKHFRMATEGFEETLGRTHPYTIAALDGLAQFLAFQKRYAEAAQCDKKVLDLSAEAKEPEDLDTARILSRMGTNLMRAGDVAAAREPLTKSLALARAGFDAGDWRLGTSEFRLGDCLSRIGAREEGEKLLLAAAKRLADSAKTPPDTLVAARQSLLEHYERTGDAEKAASIRALLPPPTSK